MARFVLALFLALFLSAGCSGHRTERSAAQSSGQGGSASGCVANPQVSAGNDEFLPFDLCSIRDVQVQPEGGVCAIVGGTLRCWDGAREDSRNFQDPRELLDLGTYGFCALDAQGVHCPRTGRLSALPSGWRNPRSIFALNFDYCALTDEGVRCVDSLSGAQVPVDSFPGGELKSVVRNGCALGSQGVFCLYATGTDWPGSKEKRAYRWGATNFPAQTTGLAVASGTICGIVGEDVACVDAGRHWHPEEKFPSRLLATKLGHPRALALAGPDLGCALTDTGVRCFGQPSGADSGALLAGPGTLLNPQKLFLREGSVEACALADDGVHCWGKGAGRRPVGLNRRRKVYELLTALDGKLCARTWNEYVCEGLRGLKPADPPVQNVGPSCLRANGTLFCSWEGKVFEERGFASARAVDFYLAKEWYDRGGARDFDLNLISCSSNGYGVQCKDQNQGSGYALPAPADLGRVDSIASAGRFTCALSEGRVRCWYSYASRRDREPLHGELTLPPEVAGASDFSFLRASPASPGAPADVICGGSSRGLLCWNSEGLVGRTAGLSGVRALSGDTRICGLSDQGAFCATRDGKVEFVLPNLSAPTSVAARPGQVCGLGGEGLVCEGDFRFDDDL